MSMNGLLRRLTVIADTLQPEDVPTWCFFRQDLFQARANHGNQPPDVVLADVEDVERIIRTYDELRTEHRLDVIDLAIAIAISTYSFPGNAQSPSGIAGMIVQAYFHWDMERFGEDRAWRHQRSRSEFEGQIAGRLAA